MRCPDEIELERLLAGDSSGGERVRLDSHVSTCATCRRWLDSARADEDLAPRLRIALRGVTGPSGHVDLAEDPPDLARYRILRRLGAGGMGVVFEAEQRNPVRRVALKVLRQTHPSPHALRRFAFEAEALARLDHPGVARVYEAGTFETARGSEPFVAMELVHGAPLDRWVAEHGPDRAARLALFLAVCDAVEHAHRKGVIHRDLKAANVLVDADGRPKVLDFGVARAVDAGVAGATSAGEVVGTLATMSPEQMAGDPGAVDTRTDVYALGVMLHELLVGRPPHDLHGLSVRAARERVERGPPVAPVPGLPRDLDVILRVALAPDPAERYGSVAALSADLRRFLRHEPIEARPAAPWERALKLARRHRLAAAAVAAVLLTLVGGIAATTRQAVRARAAERDARAHAERAGAVVDYFRALLGGDDLAGRSRPADFSLEAALDEAGERLDGALAADPEVAAQLHVTLGSAYSTLGLREPAERHLDAALALRRAHLGPRALPLAEARNARAVEAYRAGDLGLARELLEAALEVYADELDPTDARIASARTNLGNVHRSLGDEGAARELLTAAVEAFERGPAAGSAGHADALSGLAMSLAEQGEGDRALLLAGRAADLRRASAGAHYPDTAHAELVRAEILLRLDRPREALEPAREALVVLSEFRAADHRQVRRAERTVAACRAALGARARELERRARDGDRDDAQRHLAAAIDDLAPLAAEGDAGAARALARCRNDLAMLCSDLARFDRAERLLRDALEGPAGDEGETRRALRANLAAVLRWRDPRTAREHLEQLLAERRTAGDTLRAATAHNNLALVLLQLGACADAEEHARAALATWRAHLGEGDERTLVARRNLADVLLARGRWPEALRELEVVLAGALADPSARRGGEALAVLALCLDAADLPDEARHARAEALERLRGVYGVGHPVLAELRHAPARD